MKDNKIVKSFNQFNENMNISDVSNCLLKCDFEQISEEEIKNYGFGSEDDEVDLSSFEEENIYDFGYLSYDNYCIIKLDKKRGDSVLRYKDGSGNFIIKYNNKLYIGDWSEGENIIGRDDNWGNNSEVFDDFKKDMIKNNISFYYCVNF